MRGVQRFSGFVVLLVASLVAQAADAPDAIRARRRTTVDTPVELRTLAHWNEQCRAMRLPIVTWVENPAHGQVEVRKDQVMGHAPAVGETSCEGIPIDGLRLIYTPEAGFRGEDHLSFDVRFGLDRALVRYEFQVTVK